jgi:hypothetical protein
VYKLYRCKGSHLANKKIKYWIQQRSKGTTEGTSGLGHWTVRCTPDSVRCTRGLQLKLATFGNFHRHSAIIHRTVRCTPDSVRCSKEERPPELVSLGKTQRLLHYNSPDMSGVHRTIRCNSGATTTSRQRLPAGAFNARQKRAEVRHAHTGAPDIEQYMSGVHRTSRRAQKSELQRSESNGFGDVAGAPDMSGVHRTVRCTIRQSAPPNG